MFKKVSIIGLGLIGSSIIQAIKQYQPDIRMTGFDINSHVRKRAQEIGLIPADKGIITDTFEHAVKDADLVILCVPVGATSSAAGDVIPCMKKEAILSDVGSVKQNVIHQILPILDRHKRQDIVFIPAHPIAGTEDSGPESGFATLFVNRWCVLTPLDDTDEGAIGALASLWRSFAANIEFMTPEHHDKVFGITSHLPHLIAYTIVGTAADLEDDIKSEIIKYSASGFRDFTRIAASDPTMWRDVFLHNSEAVLDILQRFNEDLTALQRAIRRGEGEFLFEAFSNAREIRRGVIDAKLQPTSDAKKAS